MARTGFRHLPMASRIDSAEPNRMEATVRRPARTKKEPEQAFITLMRKPRSASRTGFSARTGDSGTRKWTVTGKRQLGARDNSPPLGGASLAGDQGSWVLPFDASQTMLDALGRPARPGQGEEREPLLHEE